MPEPGATAFAHDQTGIARERQAGGILATDQAEHSLGASHAHFPGVGTYGRQRWCVVLGVGNVVESDDRYIAADRDAAQRQSTCCAHCDDIVVTREGGCGLRAVERPFDRRTTAVACRRSLIDQGFIGSEAPTIERIAPTGDAILLRRHRCGAPDKSDTPMA